MHSQLQAEHNSTFGKGPQMGPNVARAVKGIAAAADRMGKDTIGTPTKGGGLKLSIESKGK